MTCSPNHTKLKFIDLTKEIEDCSKDQSLSMYNYQSTNCVGQPTHPGSQRKKINKRFRNNPGFTSNFFFFPSSVAVNGNTAANMAIQKEASSSCSTSSSDTSGIRRWSLQSKNDKMTAANPCEGMPAQDDKGNEMLFSEETCQSFKCPQASRNKRNGKARLQRRFSCSDYLPTKSSMTEQDLASIDNIYSPMSSYCITPNNQYAHFSFSSPDAPSLPSPPSTTNSTNFGRCNISNGENLEYEEEWDFLDPNAKKRRPSFDLNQDEMDKLFNAFSFDPNQEITPQSCSGGTFDSEIDDEASVIEDCNTSPGKTFGDELMPDQALVQQNGYVNMLQDIPTENSGDTELLFNSLPEDMKQQLVSFFFIQNNGQPEVESTQEYQTHVAEPKDVEKRSTSTTQEIDNMVENVLEQPLFEPITEVGLSELKEFGLFEDVEETTLKTSNSNDDFETFLNNL